MVTLRTEKNNRNRPDRASKQLLTQCMLAAFEATMGERLQLPAVCWGIHHTGGSEYTARTGALFPENSDGTFRAEADLTQMPDGAFRLDLVEVRREPDMFDEQGFRGIWLPSPVNMLAVGGSEPERPEDPDLGKLLSDADALVAGLKAKPRTVASSEHLRALVSALTEMCEASLRKAMAATDSASIQFVHGGRLHAAEPDPDGTMCIACSDGSRRRFQDSDVGVCMAALEAALIRAEAQ